MFSMFNRKKEKQLREVRAIEAEHAKIAHELYAKYQKTRIALDTYQELNEIREIVADEEHDLWNKMQDAFEDWYFFSLVHGEVWQTRIEIETAYNEL